MNDDTFEVKNMNSLSLKKLPLKDKKPEKILYTTDNNIIGILGKKLYIYKL